MLPPLPSDSVRATDTHNYSTGLIGLVCNEMRMVECIRMSHHKELLLIGRLRSFLIFCLILMWSAMSAHATDGPLQVRNQYPFLLAMMPPYLETAGLRDELYAGLSHSSVSVVEAEQPWTVLMDLELTEFDVRIKKRTGIATELGIDIPVIRPTGGFLDGPLEQWHDLLKVGDYGRSSLPKNTFLYEVALNNQLVVRGVNDRSGIGDVRVTAKQLVRSHAPLVSLMAGIELPTGDAKSGYGNGSYDAGAAVLADLRFLEYYQGTANFGITVPGDFRGWQTVGLRPFWHAGVSLEAAWWGPFSVVAQTLVQTSPLPETGIRQMDWPAVLLTIGGRYRSAQGSIECSLTEDLDTAGAPDFIATVGYAAGF